MRYEGRSVDAKSEDLLTGFPPCHPQWHPQPPVAISQVFSNIINDYCDGFSIIMTYLFMTKMTISRIWETSLLPIKPPVQNLLDGPNRHLFHWELYAERVLVVWSQHSGRIVAHQILTCQARLKGMEASPENSDFGFGNNLLWIITYTNFISLR
jgi:hypothetical protein